jgi:hypothetical protein
MDLWPVRGRAADVAVAAVIGAFVIGTTVGKPEEAGLEPGLLGWVLLVGSCLVLVWRRRYPIAVLFATFLECALYYPFVGAGGPILLTYVVGLFSAAPAGSACVVAPLAGPPRAVNGGRVGVVQWRDD